MHRISALKKTSEVLSKKKWCFFFLQLRDLKAVGIKFWHVLYPKQSKTLLKECKYLRRLLINVVRRTQRENLCKLKIMIQNSQG